MLLLGLGALLGYPLLLASSRKMENDGGGGYAPPQYAPPQYAPQPPQYAPPPQYGGGQYDAHDVYNHREQYGHYHAEVRIHSKDGHSFWTVAQYSTICMEFKVDNGANVCVIGDKAYSYLRRAIGSEMQETSTSFGNGKTSKSWRFVFPYLTVGEITLRDVECVYVPGAQRNLLGATFLNRCDYNVSGGVMTIRGR
jgi:predicted aspartyl protease